LPTRPPSKKALAELRAEREEVLIQLQESAAQLQESEAKHKKIISEIHSEREELLYQLLENTRPANQIYTLTYFDARGRAEQLRLLFSECGIVFNDVRLPRDDWEKVKPTTPTGSVPFLDHNGIKLCESVAQLVYVAKNHSRWPHSAVSEAQALMVIGVAEDFRRDCFAARFSLESEKPMKTGKLLELLDQKLPYLEKLLEKDGFFVDSRFTAADVSLWDILDQIVAFTPEANDIIIQFQHIKEWKERFEQLPNIAKYLQSRK